MSRSVRARWASVAVAAGLWAASGVASAQGGYSVVNNGPNNNPGAIGVVPSAMNQEGPSSRTLGSTRRLAVNAAPRRPEDYGGVTPGAPHLAPGLARMARLRRGNGAVVAWPGFQMTPTGSRVFVAMAGTPAVTVTSPSPLVRVYHMVGARIVLSNNRRPLITESFATPLRRAYLRAVRGGVDLVLELRAPVEPNTSTDVGPHGLQFFYVDLPSFQSPELVRLQLPNGQVVVTPDANPPVSPIPPQPLPPGVDNERPPPVRR